MPDITPLIRLGWRAASARGNITQFDDDLRERVIAWEYTDKSNGADEGRLTMDNFDLSLFDHEAFQPSSRIYVQWGYGHSIHPLREIAIEKLKGFRTLTVGGSVTEARGLLGVQKTRTFPDSTEFEVARSIANELGFRQNNQLSIDPGDIETSRRGITQTGETDMAFLQRLALRVGATIYITGGVFHFHQRRLDEQSSLTFTYFNDGEGTILGEPDIEQTIQGRPGRVTRSGRSTRNRRRVSGEASNRSDTARPVLGQELPVSDPDGFDWASIAEEIGADPSAIPQAETAQASQAQSDVSPTTAQSDEEARSQARQRFRQAERMSIKMSLTVVGEPRARADVVVTIAGMSQRFDGNWYIAEAMHNVRAGDYTTRLKLSRNATSRSRGSARARQRENTQNTAALPAGADLPFSSEFGTWDSRGNYNLDGPPDFDVRQVRDTDPDGQERIRYQSRTGDLPQTRPPDPWEEGS